MRHPALRKSSKGRTRRQNATMGCFMRDIITSYLTDESGAAAAEYALILAIVAAGIAGAVKFLGSTISTAITNAAGYVSIATS
jgi:pilus assembly protein Flp/PilA